MMRPNWFVAIPCRFEEDFLATLGEVPKEVRLFDRTDYHLTLAFLGPVGEELAYGLWNRINLAETRSFHFEPHRAEAFGPPNKPSAIAVVSDKIDPNLGRIFDEIRTVSAMVLGKKIEHRPFRPHITIARPQRKIDPDAYRQVEAWFMALDFTKQAPLLMSEIALYTWNHDRSKKLFRIVEKKPIIDHHV